MIELAGAISGSLQYLWLASLMFGDSLRPEEATCIGATVQLVRTYSEIIYLDRSFCLTLLSFLSHICRAHTVHVGTHSMFAEA